MTTSARARFILCALGLLCLTALLLWPPLAFARAGGGGGYSGGGGGGGFGGGGGGGGGDGIIFLIYLLVRYPAVGVPVAIVVAVFFFYGGRAGRAGYVTRTIQQGHRLQSAGGYGAAEAKIRERDPGFSAEALAQRCAGAFPGIQDAWSAQNMTAVRHFISDGIYERFQIQIEMQKSSYIRNVMTAVSVSSARVVSIRSDAFFDTAHVLFTASATDYTEDTRSGKRVQGSTQPETFSEVWSFLRRPGATTLAKPGLLEGHCPNCATPLQISDAVQCPSCQALVNSGEYDWVLSEITQTEEWADRPPRAVPGMDQLRERDPALNAQHIEDKASVIFWRLRAAEFFASPNHVRKLALPEFLAAHTAEFRAAPDGKHSFAADAAVGSAELAGIEVSADGSGPDRAHVHVKWSAHEETRKVPSLMPPEYEKSRFRSEDFVLVRMPTCRTSDKNTLTSAHCPTCGAPQTRSAGDVCEYCSAVQNDGGNGWVLGEVKPFFGFTPAIAGRAADSAGAEPLPPMSPRDNERLLQSAAAVMMADGEIDEREQGSLRKMAARRGIDETRLSALVAQVRTEGTVLAPGSGTVAQNREFLRALVVMCLADGNVTGREKKLIKSLVGHMKYTDVDVDQMIKRERGSLFKQSKLVIKQSG